MPYVHMGERDVYGPRDPDPAMTSSACIVLVEELRPSQYTVRKQY
jgi:hypothetical protein